MFKVNNKSTWKTSPISKVSIVNFEQVNVSWVTSSIEDDLYYIKYNI